MIKTFIGKSQEINRSQLDQSRLQPEVAGSIYIFIDSNNLFKIFTMSLIKYFVLDLSKWTDPFGRKSDE